MYRCSFSAEPSAIGKMLHAIVQCGTQRLLRLVVLIVSASLVDLLAASPTTVYDSYSENQALLVRSGVDESSGREQHSISFPRNPLSPATAGFGPVQRDTAETLPVQQQLLGGGGVTRVPWYGLTELSDILLLGVLVTVAVIGTLLFVVLVLGLRAKLHLFREQRADRHDLLLRSADYVQQLQVQQCSGIKCSGSGSKLKLIKTPPTPPSPPIVLLEPSALVKPVPTTCIAVNGADSVGGGRRRVEQHLSLSDKRHRETPKANKRLPAVSVPLPVATVNMSASIGATVIDTATANSERDTEHLTIDDKENCVQLVPSDQGEEQQPVEQRNVLKRQTVAEQQSVFGQPGTPGNGSPTTYIQLLTPSSASSLSTSAATTDNNATPTKGPTECGGGSVSGGPLSAAESMAAAARFGFSPRSIHSFTVQTATYFRFPDVDDFTPTPRTLPKRHSGKDTCSTPPAVDARTEEQEEENDPARRMEMRDGPKVSVLAPSPGSMPLPPAPPIKPDPPKIERAEDSAPVGAKEKARICAPMANRRVRLKSISLDSEGARLVEENLSSTIPVQELVGMAAHRSGGFDSVIDDDDDDDEDDDDEEEYERKPSEHDKANASAHHETEDEDEQANAKRCAARAKRVRNILNLRLNIPPMPGSGIGAVQSHTRPPPPAASQSTGSVAKPIVKTVTVTGSVSNPTMSTQQQAQVPQTTIHHHHLEDSNEQFYFEYFDYGDDEDETDDEEYDEVLYGVEHEDNNNNNNSNSTHTVALPPVPKTPTLSQSKQKASSLDSDKLKVANQYGTGGGGGSSSAFGSVSCGGGMSHIMSIAQPTTGQGMSMHSYLHSQSQQQQQQQQQYGQFQFHQQHQQQQHQQQFYTTQQTTGQLQQPRRVSSVSVPTTPKRYQYRTAVNHHYYHHQQQHHASGQSKLKPSYHHAGPTSSSSSSTALAGDGAPANGNRKDKKSPLGLKAIAGCDGTVTPQSQSPSDKEKAEDGAKTSVPTSGRSSILQRRGSNHSLTLNLDVYNRGGSVDLTSSSCSLYRGSYKNLHQVQSHTQLYQPHPVEPPVRVQCHQASPQQQQPTPAGSSCTGDGSANSTTNVNNNNNSNTNKKNLLQRRGSNTSLTLNLRSSVGTGAGGGGGGGGGGGAGGVGSSFGLNRFSSHNSLNTGTNHAVTLGTLGGGGSHHHQQHQQLPSSSMVRLAGSRKSLLERRNSNASLTLINVNQRTLSVSNCNLRGSICSLNSLLTTHTQNEPAPSGMMLEEDELDGNGDNDHHHHHHHHHHHQHHGHHHQQHGHHGQHGIGGHHSTHHRVGGELRRFGSSVDASFSGHDGTATQSDMLGANETGNSGRACTYGRLTVSSGHTSMDQHHHGGGPGHHENSRGNSRQRKFRSSDSLHNLNAREQSLQGCEMMMGGGRQHHHGHGGNERTQLEGDGKLMSVSTYQQRSCQSSFDERHHYGSSENFKEHQNKLSIHRGLFQKDPSTVTSTSSANNLSALGTGSLYNCCCGCCCCCCCCTGTLDGSGCCDGNGLALKAGNLSISNSNVRNISTKPLSPQTTSEDFKIYLANIQFLQNASNVLTIAYLRKLHNFFSKTYRKMVASAAGAQEAFRQQRTHSKEAPDDGKQERTQLDGTVQVVEAPSTKMMLLHSDSLHHPPVCDDESYDEEHKKMVLKIHQEFWDLPTNYQEKPLVFGSQAKNRYKTILPNEHSRVILEPERAPVAGGEPYINANYIKGPDYANNSYIATQGPLPNTIYEFWLMVYQNMARTAAAAGLSLQTAGLEQKIVMLTNFVENGRQKCAIYFPQSESDWLAFGNTADVDVSEVLREKDNLAARISQHEDQPAVTVQTRCESCFFLVQNVCVEQRNGYTVRTLNVIYGAKAPEGPEADADGSAFELVAFRAHHYWFPDWPDHRSPNDINVLLDLSLDVLGSNVLDTPRPESNNSLKGNQPGTPGLEEVVGAAQLAALSSATPTVLPIIHCSAGIGRTGCLIAILNGLRQLRLSVMAHQRKQQQLKQSTQLVPPPPSVPCSDDKRDDTNPSSESHKTVADALQDELEQSLPLPPVPDGTDGRRKSATSAVLTTTSGGNGTFRAQRDGGSVLRESGQVDILGIVCNLRLQRGGMVQNSEQYELIHRALCLYLEKLTQDGHI